MLQQLGRSLLDGGVKQGQMDRQVGVFVSDFHKNLSHLNRNGQFFPTFPYKSLFLGLPRLHLAAYELPQEPPSLVGRTQADQESIALPYEGGDYFGHGFPPMFLMVLVLTSYSITRVAPSKWP